MISTLKENGERDVDRWEEYDISVKMGRNGGLVTGGYEFPVGVDELHCCLAMFAGNGYDMVPEGAKYAYLRRSVDLAFNCSGSIRRIVWNEWTERILKLGVWNWVNKKRFYGVAGCSSSGKSDTWGLLGMMVYRAQPADTYVLVLSESKGGAKMRVWRSITQMFGQASRVGCPGKLLASIGKIKGVDRLGNLTDNSGFELLAAGVKDSDQACARMQGVKNKTIVVVADEFTELGIGILNTAVENLTSNDRVLFGALANPNLLGDAFGELCEPEKGWKSVDISMERWKTKLGYCIRLNAEKSPRITETDGDRFFWQPDLEYCERIEKARGGKNSRGYHRFVLAWWCPEGVSNTIYSELEFTNGACLIQDEPRWDGEPWMLSALDPAFSRGGDRNQSAFAKLGKVDGRSHLHFCSFQTIQDDVANKTVPLTHQVIREWKRLCEDDWGVRPTRAIMDGSGGGMVVGHISDVEWSPAVQKVNFKSKSSGRTVVFRSEECEYYNKNSELWIQMKAYVRSNQISGISREAMAELVSREFHKTEGRSVRVEGKEDYKSRNGGKSPDLADVVLMMVEKAITLGQFASEEIKKVTGTLNQGWKMVSKTRSLSTTCGKKMRR